ncbi:transglutaminase family protein [uncultured Methanobrevibacter sp.]|uniref:transglutaminase-like domain-containing protein n=1 Tax=uncultured Methanobrevibacter sp. TaxID=253161 RepID=UPI0026050DFA|nr:transglutaminase-like domain-containing protein [uncultured Methanobrevibacter sp.]
MVEETKKDVVPQQYSIERHLWEVYKTDEENFEPYTPNTDETTDETTEENTDETTEEEEEDKEGFTLHQGEILEIAYCNQLNSMEYSMDYEDISSSSTITLPYTYTDLNRVYLGVRTLLRMDWEAYNEKKDLKELSEVHLAFITEETFSDDMTKLTLAGMTKLLDVKYKFNFTQMLRSKIIEEVIKTAGLKAEVNPEGLDDQVIDYTNISSEGNDDDGGIYNGDIPTDVKELSKRICKGKKGCMAKLKAIYAWEQKHITYEGYSNSPTNNWDPSKILKDLSINCCDTACLTVHLVRAQGIKCNYVYNSSHCWCVAYCKGEKVYLDYTDKTRAFGKVWKDMTGTEGEKAYGGNG